MDDIKTLMDRIREAEETAGRRMAEAEARMPGLLAKAEGEGREVRRRMLDQASAEANGQRQAAATQAAAIKAAARRGMEEEIARLDATVATRLEPAVIHLVDTFLSRYGGREEKD